MISVEKNFDHARLKCNFGLFLIKNEFLMILSKIFFDRSSVSRNIKMNHSDLIGIIRVGFELYVLECENEYHMMWLRFF